MAYREVTVIQMREALRRWLRGEGERPIARGIGVDRKTARRYIAAAAELGVDRSGGEGQLTDELIGRLAEAVRPVRTDGHGEAWRSLLAEEEQIKKWVTEDELTVVKIGILLERKGVVVPHRTLARFAVERCGAGKRTTTVRVDDPPPGTELQVDFGRLGLVPDGDRHRVCQGLIFTACFSRHQFVWPTLAQTTEEVIRGFEAAWGFFGGVFPVVIPDNMKSIVIQAENCAPRGRTSPRRCDEARRSRRRRGRRSRGAFGRRRACAAPLPPARSSPARPGREVPGEQRHLTGPHRTVPLRPRRLRRGWRRVVPARGPLLRSLRRDRHPRGPLRAGRRNWPRRGGSQ